MASTSFLISSSPTQNDPSAQRALFHCCAVSHSGTPVGGHQEKVANVQAYISGPINPSDESKGVILYFSDVFGPFFINNQLIMDYYASHGFTVPGLDYFFGEPIHECMYKPDFDRPGWIGKALTPIPVHGPTLS